MEQRVRMDGWYSRGVAGSRRFVAAAAGARGLLADEGAGVVWIAVLCAAAGVGIAPEDVADDLGGWAFKASDQDIVCRAAIHIGRAAGVAAEDIEVANEVSAVQLYGGGASRGCEEDVAFDGDVAVTCGLAPEREFSWPLYVPVSGAFQCPSRLGALVAQGPVTV